MSDKPPRNRSEKRQRTARLFLRLSPAEQAALATRADKAGMTPPAYLRAAALGTAGPRAQRRTPADATLLRQVLGQLGRVGNNLNQIARHLNTGREGDQGEALTEALAEYARMRDALYVALGKDPDHAGPAAPTKTAAAMPALAADFAAAASPPPKPSPTANSAADSAPPVSRFTSARPKSPGGP